MRFLCCPYEYLSAGEIIRVGATMDCTHDTAPWKYQPPGTED